MDTQPERPLALVVEDYPDQAMVFGKALELVGYVTEVIHDGAIAQVRLAETTPALVLLDLHLPNVSGDALLRQVRLDPRLKKTRVILATADALLAEKLRPVADLVLLKPISFAQLTLLANKLMP